MWTSPSSITRSAVYAVTMLSVLWLRVSVHNSRERMNVHIFGRQQKSIGPQQLQGESRCLGVRLRDCLTNNLCSFDPSLHGALTWRQEDSQTFVNSRRRETEWEILSVVITGYISFGKSLFNDMSEYGDEVMQMLHVPKNGFQLQNQLIHSVFSIRDIVIFCLCTVPSFYQNLA